MLRISSADLPRCSAISGTFSADAGRSDSGDTLRFDTSGYTASNSGGRSLYLHGAGFYGVEIAAGVALTAP